MHMQKQHSISLATDLLHRAGQRTGVSCSSADKVTAGQTHLQQAIFAPKHALRWSKRTEDLGILFVTISTSSRGRESKLCLAALLTAEAQLLPKC
jgi:hypothetical protein